MQLIDKPKRKTPTYPAASLAAWTASTKAPYRCLRCQYVSDLQAGIRTHFLRAHGSLMGATIKSAMHAVPPAMARLTLSREDAAAPPLNGKTPRKVRTAWSLEELELMYQEVMALWLVEPAAGYHKAVLDKAMHKALPAARWRALAGPSQVPALTMRVRAEMARLVAAGLNPPAPVVRIETVPAPFVLADVLRTVSLPKLCGIVAEREAAARLAYWEREPAAGPARRLPEPSLTDQGAPLASIAALFPRVQVIGLRPTQHAELVKTFAGKPVHILPSIDPSRQFDETLLGPDAAYFIDTKAMPDNKWSNGILVARGTGHHHNLYGAGRITDHIRELVNAWAGKHPAAYLQWQTARLNNGSH